MLRIYNTLTRSVETFKPLKPGEVSMYTCGPTVYDYAHIGNFRSYVFADLLRRTLERAGLNVKQVMNITDVDDKTIAGSQAARVSLKEFTQRYEQAFFEDLKSLRIKPAMLYPRATEHIPQMIELILKLMEAGYAYKAEDGVYFDISKFSDYGKLSHIPLAELKPGSRSRIQADSYTSEQFRDFALWKAWKPEDGDVVWETPFGKGRPGWHIECSAMSMHYLGPSFDIHTGGIDLIFPHHENEIAQSEGATGKQFVRYWVHCEHLLVNNQKMSKSLGNIITLRDVLAKGYTPSALRYFLLSGHYRTQLNFTWEALQHSQDTIEKLNDFVAKLYWLLPKLREKPQNHELLTALKVAKHAFEKKLENDLDMPSALVHLHEVIAITNKEIDRKSVDSRSIGAVIDFIHDVNAILDVLNVKELILTEQQKKLIEKREELRRQKNFDAADAIRSELEHQGIGLEDTPWGPRPFKK
jgi:cysteinyl-tRNA synthetase